MIGALLLASVVAASSCHTNPWWYISGQISPLDDAQTVQNTSQLCPTTHFSGGLSCCTEQSLRETEKRITANVGAIQMVLDTLELAAQKPDIVSALARIYQRQLGGMCMKQPHRKTNTGYANVVAEQAIAMTWLQVVRDGIAPFSNNWGKLRSVAVDIGRIMANVSLGSACLACAPEQQMKLTPPPGSRFEEIEDALGGLVLQIKGDDNEEFERLLNGNEVRTLLRGMLHSARSNTQAQLHALVNAAQSVCVPVELPEDVSRTAIQTLAMAKIQDWWGNSLLAANPDESMDAIVELASEETLEWAWQVVTNFGWMLSQTTFAAQGLSGYREAIEEVWNYALNCAGEFQKLGSGERYRLRAECSEPPRLFKELSSLHRTWLSSTHVREHLARFKTYDKELILQGLTRPLSETDGVPYRYVDLYRLVHIPVEEDDAPEGSTEFTNNDLFPEIEFIEPDSADTGIGVGPAPTTYDIAAAPLAVAKESQVHSDAQVVKPYNPLGNGLPTLSLVTSSIASLVAIMIMVL